MWQQLLKTFFIGQVALEQATEASKKTLDKARERAKEYQQKAQEYKDVQIKAKLETGLKERIAELRHNYTPFEKACETLSKLLSETSEIKNQLVTIQSK
jgi:hypothetical protein